MSNDRPHLGQTVYGDTDKRVPYVVVGYHDDGTGLLLVPAGTNLRSTHKGNVYNADGVREWQT